MRAALLCCAAAAAGAAAAAPAAPQRLAAQAGGDAECNDDGSCTRGLTEGSCIDNVGDFADIIPVEVATRLTVRGEDTCALWLWELDGKPLGVWWNGFFRGVVQGGQCLELYAAPGYTMDTSNVTVTCGLPLQGCNATVATNPPGTQCDGDGDLSLTSGVKAAIVLSCLCCAALLAAFLYTCIRRRSRREQYVTVYGTPAPITSVVAVQQQYDSTLVVGQPVAPGRPIQE